MNFVVDILYRFAILDGVMTMHNQFNYLQADEIGKLAQITPEELCDDCGEVNHSWSYNKPTGEAAQLCSGCYDNQSE